jgi:hypothetical protein
LKEIFAHVKRATLDRGLLNVVIMSILQETQCIGKAWSEFEGKTWLC